jgi:CubicO group peptidase (beta-lactamase class C family)
MNQSVPHFWTRRAALASAAGALLALVACGGGDPDAVKPAQITAVLNAARGPDPGLAAAWISSDAILLAASGTTRLGGTVPLSTDMWFHLGSNQKSIVAMALAVQEEKGRLRWNSTLAELFPELAASMLPAYRGVTVENLLSHRAGFIELLSAQELQVVPSFEGDASSQRLQFLSWTTSIAPLGTPGVTYRYSNAGYGVAGAVLEKVTGKTFEAAMAEAVFRPLGLRYVFAYPPQVPGTQPAGHEVNDQGTALVAVHLTDPLYTVPSYIVPAGHLSMPLADYARLAQVELRGLTGKPALLTAESFHNLHTSRGLAPDLNLGYALGWVIEPQTGNATLSWSVGQLIGFTATIMVSPATDRAVVLLANYNDGLRPGLMDRTARQLLALRP